MYKSGWVVLGFEKLKFICEKAGLNLPVELLLSWWADMEEDAKVIGPALGHESVILEKDGACGGGVKGGCRII